MKAFVFWTGMANLAAGICLQFPAVSLIMVPTEPPGMILHVFGALAIFLGIMLALCSRDLEHRAALVLWEGVLRVAAFVIMAGYGVFGGLGFRAVLGGVFDLSIGLVYLIAIPKVLKISLLDGLLDKTIA